MTKSIDKLSLQLKPLFEREPIEIAYLYGSVMAGENDKLSDYDFGILFSERLSQKMRFELRLQLFGELGKKIGVYEENIDVVDLEKVPVLLQFNVISGRTIFCRNDDKRVEFETYVMSRYHDQHYYLDRYIDETIRKIEKGVYFDRQISYT